MSKLFAETMTEVLRPFRFVAMVGPGEYRTLCSVIIEVLSDVIRVYHVVNRFPCETEYETMKLDVDRS